MIFFFLTVGQDIKERFSGAIEAFARRNASAGRHGEPSRHRTLEDVNLSRDMVRFTFPLIHSPPILAFCRALLCNYGIINPNNQIVLPLSQQIRPPSLISMSVK